MTLIELSVTSASAISVVISTSSSAASNELLSPASTVKVGVFLGNRLSFQFGEMSSGNSIPERIGSISPLTLPSFVLIHVEPLLFIFYGLRAFKHAGVDHYVGFDKVTY